MSNPREIIRSAERALQEGTTAREVARALLHQADRAGALSDLVSVLGEWDPGIAEDLVVDHLLRHRRNGGSAREGGLVELADTDAVRNGRRNALELKRAEAKGQAGGGGLTLRQNANG